MSEFIQQLADRASRDVDALVLSGLREIGINAIDVNALRGRLTAAHLPSGRVEYAMDGKVFLRVSPSELRQSGNVWTVSFTAEKARSR